MPQFDPEKYAASTAASYAGLGKLAATCAEDARMLMELADRPQTREALRRLTLPAIHGCRRRVEALMLAVSDLERLLTEETEHEQSESTVS